MPTKKMKDFTQAETDRFSGMIGGIDGIETEETEDITETTDAQEHKQKKSRAGRKGYYTGEIKEEYRFTCRMPGEYGAFLQEWAWMNRSTITDMIQDLVKEAMGKHPEVFESMDALNKKQGA